MWRPGVVMSSEISVLIADDHPIFRLGLRKIIEKDPRIRVVAEAGDGETALQQLAECGAGIAILDVDMPNKDGFDVVRAMRQQRWGGEVVFLTMHKDEQFLNAALDLGIKGYVLKDSALTEIVQCILSVASGQHYVSPQLSGFLVRRSRRAAELAAAKPQVAELSPTERRILLLISDYKTSKEIAGELCISTRTVEHHRANISEKLDLKGSHSLLKFAVEHKSEL
jgi:DNA-binding NarL/FixJ family response regulator